MKILILANARAVHTQRWAKALCERGHDVTVNNYGMVDNAQAAYKLLPRLKAKWPDPETALGRSGVTAGRELRGFRRLS